MWMLVQLVALLLLFHAMGTGLVLWLALPISGPIAGMLLLFLFLCARGGLSGEAYTATTASLRHMSLLFIPAGAGLMVQMDAFREEWKAIVLAVLGGTVCTLAATALSLRIFRRLHHLFAAHPAEKT